MRASSVKRGFVLFWRQGEGVKRIESMATESLIEDTLLCFVLVDGASGHAFCSRYDFGPHPLLPEVNHLAAPAEQVCFGK